MTPTTEANWRAAFGLALALVGDRGRAEELAQEAFLRVAERGEVEDEQRPLLLATVRNLSIDELRRYRVEYGRADQPFDRRLERVAPTDDRERRFQLGVACRPGLTGTRGGAPRSASLAAGR